MKTVVQIANELAMASIRLTTAVTGYALPEFFGSLIRASAEQRAKAFLRTIGKWEDAK